MLRRLIRYSRKFPSIYTYCRSCCVLMKPLQLRPRLFINDTKSNGQTVYQHEVFVIVTLNFYSYQIDFVLFKGFFSPLLMPNVYNVSEVNINQKENQ